MKPTRRTMLVAARRRRRTLDAGRAPLLAEPGVTKDKIILARSCRSERLARRRDTDEEGCDAYFNPSIKAAA